MIVRGMITWAFPTLGLGVCLWILSGEWAWGLCGLIMAIAMLFGAALASVVSEAEHSKENV